MKLSDEHMGTFSDVANSNYEHRIAGFLRKHFPEDLRTEHLDFKNNIHESVLSAESYGFKTERQIAKFVVVAWMLGGEFDAEFPAAKAILLDPHLDPDRKSDKLFQWCESIFEVLEKDD